MPVSQGSKVNMTLAQVVERLNEDRHNLFQMLDATELAQLIASEWLRGLRTLVRR